MMGSRSLLVLALLTSTGSHQARSAEDAQSEGAIQMELCVGFEGHRPASRHVPVTAILRNRGPDVRGRLVFEQRHPAQGKGRAPQSRRSVPVSLPRGSRHRIQVLTFVTAGEPLKCKFVSRGNLIAEAAAMPSSEHPLVVLDSRGLPNLPPDLRMTPVCPPMWQLPDCHVGYSGAAGVLVGNMDLGSLSLRQQQALEGFVLHGGTLVVSCTGNVGALRTGPVGRLIDLTESSSQDLPIGSAFERRYRAQLESDLRVPCRTLTAVERGGLLWCVGSCIAFERQVGSGKVIWVSFDLWRDWQEDRGFAPAFWRDLKSRFLKSRGSPLLYAMRNLPSHPEVDAYPIAWTGMFMLAYAVCVGPGAYWLLKRRGREMALWVLIPILTGVLVPFHPLLRCSHDRAKSNLFLSTVVRARPGQTTATFRSSALLFSRGREQHRLAVEAPSAMAVAGHPFADRSFTYHHQKQGTRSLPIEGRIVPACHVRSFAVQGTVELPEPPSARVVVRPDGLWLHAENPLEGPLENLHAYVGAGAWRPLRDIPPHGRAEKNLLPLDATVRQVFGWSLFRERYPDVADVLWTLAAEPTHTWLLAQTDLPTPQWQHDNMIELKRHTQALLTDVPIDYEHEGRFFVPFGAAERTALTRRRAMPQVVEFRLPVRGFSLHATKLLLKCSEAPRLAGKVEAFNCAQGRWLELPGQWQKHPVSKREQMLWRMTGCEKDVYLMEIPSPNQSVLWPEGIIALRNSLSFGRPSERTLEIQVEGQRLR